MKSIKIILTCITALVLMSCGNQESLDKYYVTHQEKQGFMTIDVPTNILGIDENKFTAAQKKAYESVTKLNFLGFKKSESDEATFTSEKLKVTTILANTDYKELMSFKDDGKAGVIKYTGKPNAIDELVLFGTQEEDGFAIVRVLGNDMNPQNIFEMMQTIRGENIQTEELKRIGNFFGDFQELE